ncbi:MAG: hypothetical protein K5675_02025 [Lachnospiraceae bacterium]|nr:hypothetical protein [Lachnospiraceae bacterium]
MITIIENYGRMIILCVCMGLVLTLIFGLLRYEGKQGILNIAGDQGDKYAQKVVENQSSLEYDHLLSLERTPVEVKEDLKSNTTYTIENLFVSLVTCNI